jgi:hypothetical protein
MKSVASVLSLFFFAGFAPTACGLDSVGRLAVDGRPNEPEEAPPSLPAASSSDPAGASAPPGDRDGGAPGDDATAVPACSDRALAFDGVDDFASIPADASLDLPGDFTVEAWVKPGPRAATGEEMHVVSHHDQTASRGWSLLLRNRRFELVLWGSDTLGPMAYSAGNAGPEYVVAGAWMHVVGTVSGDMMRIYAGGALRDTQLLGSDFVRQADPQATTIGRPAFTSAQFFEGLVDDVRLSKGARATGDTSPIPIAPLASDATTIALYRFDEAGGPSIDDTAAGGVHGGTIGNGARAPSRVVVPCASMR